MKCKMFKGNVYKIEKEINKFLENVNPIKISQSDITDSLTIMIYYKEKNMKCDHLVSVDWQKNKYYFISDLESESCQLYEYLDLRSELNKFCPKCGTEISYKRFEA